MKIFARCTLLSLLLFSVCSYAQDRNFVRIRPDESLDEIVQQAAHVVPSPRQWEWQKLEFIGFIHFGMNTFTGKEWGDGKTDPALFNPTALDARQWVRIAKMAGMKMLILTAKHHDGFCLWPSAYTSYSVKSSPWRHGKGDVVRELADACHEAGMKFGFYLSPWDRHEATYGDSPKYNEYFCSLLRELLTNYGEISEVWFDGANGEGPNGKKQVYDWQSYYRVIRELQPNAVIAIMGPDVRWVGTESGYGRETEWSVLPDEALNVDSIAAHSQQTALDAAFVPRNLMNVDLGSRDRLAHATALIWYPAETDVSIRPGWFYHPTDDSHVKTPAELADIYFSSVGRNSVLLLNVPPDTRGRIASPDSSALSGMRKILDRTFSRNLLSGAECTATTARPGHDVLSVLDNSPDTYWQAAQGEVSAELQFTLPKEHMVDVALLQEHIRTGQRIEHFRIDAWNGVEWRRCAMGTTVGYERLLRFAPVSAGKFRLVIEGSRGSPTLSRFGLFHNSLGSP